MRIIMPFTTITVKKKLDMPYEEKFSYHLRFFPRMHFFEIINISLIISVYFSTRPFVR